MEKISQSLRQEYLPLTLYSEELQKISDEILNVGEKLEIIVGDYKYNTVAELIDHLRSQTINEIEIKFWKPYGRIRLTKLGAEIYIGDNSPTSSGLFYKLDNILKSGLKKPSFAYSYYTIWTINILFPIINFLVKSSAWDVFYGLVFAWLLWVFFVRIKKHSTVILKNKSDAPNFLNRNADQIWLLILGAILGVVITKSMDVLPPLEKDFFKISSQIESSEKGKTSLK